MFVSGEGSCLERESTVFLRENRGEYILLNPPRLTSAASTSSRTEGGCRDKELGSRGKGGQVQF